MKFHIELYVNYFYHTNATIEKYKTLATFKRYGIKSFIEELPHYLKTLEGFYNATSIVAEVRKDTINGLMVGRYLIDADGNILKDLYEDMKGAEL